MGRTAASKQKILVVEDETDLSSSLAYALRANGYDAMVADRGVAALQALDSFRPDLVLLDLMLPDMSGLEICRKVRGASSGPQPAVIIL
jgi:DNA-binding response OmpR family regulator